jgi:hypothetical protein
MSIVNWSQLLIELAFSQASIVKIGLVTPSNLEVKDRGIIGNSALNLPPFGLMDIPRRWVGTDDASKISQANAYALAEPYEAAYEREVLLAALTQVDEAMRSKFRVPYWAPFDENINFFEVESMIMSRDSIFKPPMEVCWQTCPTHLRDYVHEGEPKDYPFCPVLGLRGTPTGQAGCMISGNDWMGARMAVCLATEALYEFTEL